MSVDEECKSWCILCERWLPHMEKFSKTQRKKNVESRKCKACLGGGEAEQVSQEMHERGSSVLQGESRAEQLEKELSDLQGVWRPGLDLDPIVERLRKFVAENVVEKDPPKVASRQEQLREDRPSGSKDTRPRSRSKRRARSPSRQEQLREDRPRGSKDTRPRSRSKRRARSPKDTRPRYHRR